MENVRYVLDYKPYCDRMEVRVVNGAARIEFELPEYNAVGNNYLTLNEKELNDLIWYLTECKKFLYETRI